MSDDLYRVLYRDEDGQEQLTGAMPLDAARSRAHGLKNQGYEVGSVMGDVAARGYMHARYAPTYRGVRVPDDVQRDRDENRQYAVKYAAWKRGVDAELGRAKTPKPAAEENPFAPDLTMSREAADYILRAVTGLLKDGYWPKAYTGYSPDDVDEKDYDIALIRKAADIVGRDKIKSRELLGQLAELDAEAEG